MLQANQLIGFGAGVSGGLSALTSITAAMWGGTTAKYTLSNDDVAKTGSGGGFANIRIINSAPVLDGDFVWQYTQAGDGGNNTDSSYGFYDISEDSTWSATDYRQNLHLMTNSFWFDMVTGLSPSRFQTYEGGTGKTSNLPFSVGDTIKWQRTGTSLKLFTGGVERYEWTGVSESLRFCMSGFTVNAANISDVQFQN